MDRSPSSVNRSWWFLDCWLATRELFHVKTKKFPDIENPTSNFQKNHQNWRKLNLFNVEHFWRSCPKWWKSAISSQIWQFRRSGVAYTHSQVGFYLFFRAIGAKLLARALCNRNMLSQHCLTTVWKLMDTSCYVQKQGFAAFGEQTRQS